VTLIKQLPITEIESIGLIAVNWWSWQATNTGDCLSLLHCVSKNIPDVFSYNSRKHWRIFI